MYYYNTMISQYNMVKGIKIFGEEDIEVADEKLQQLYVIKIVVPIYLEKMPRE